MKRILPVLAALGMAACGTDVSGPSSSLLSCVFGEPTQLAPGGALQVKGAGNQGVCLAGDQQSEFLYVPFHATGDTAAGLALELTGAGLADAGIEAAPDPGTPRLGTADGVHDRFRIDHGFHDRLRRRERRELTPLIKPGGALPASASVTGPVAADVPMVGDLHDFNVAINCDTADADLRTGEVAYVSDHAVVYVDTANPADLPAEDYAYFGVTFDTLVHPVEVAHFGEATDIDANARSILFFTRAVNERTQPGANTLTIGFFWSGDLFPEVETDRLQACPASNHSEMFYLIAPDPNGDVGIQIDLSHVRNLAVPLIGHEYQHLINASRRLFVNDATTFEDPWLNEGLSHVAEELLYLAVSGLESDANLDIDDVLGVSGPADSIFNRYMGNNFSNFADYMSAPADASVMGPANTLSTRGAAWSFLRYAADRSGRDDTEFFFDVVNAPNAGLDNLQDVIGGDRSQVLGWMRDWGVSVYTDDFVDGVDARFTASTWNLRSLYNGSTLERYPLRVRTLTNGQTINAELMAGGATFNGFQGVADGRAVVDVQAGGRTPPPTLLGTFLRVR